MDILSFLSCIAMLYGAIYFIDQFLKSCLNVPYLMFLENVGLKLQPFQIYFFSTIFNRPIAKLAFSHKKLFRFWFSIGVVIVIGFLLPSIILLVYNIAQQLREKPVEVSQQVLQPIVPGINMPVEEIPYYFLTLLIASVIHEAGHALAAAEEDVHINGFGFLFLFALPGAYVDLSTDGVRKLPPFRQLKILCAGVWHNIVLAVVAYAIGATLPITLGPFYDVGKGVLVLNIERNSPARGPNGLFPLDVIDNVNFCPVLTAQEWKDCLVKNAANNQVGFCVSERIVNRHDETIYHSFVRPDGSVECCDHSDGESKLCFELQNEEASDVGETPMQPYSCMPARAAVEGSSSSCKYSTECQDGDAFCLAPSVKNASRLLAISRRSSKESPEKYVLYLGPPGRLYFTVKVSNYIPKSVIFSPWLPYFLEIMTDYLVKFSGALGIMNLIPCLYLDGYLISGALIEMFLGKRLDAFARKIVHVFISTIGASLLLFTFVLGIWNIL